MGIVDDGIGANGVVDDGTGVDGDLGPMQTTK